MDVIVQQSPSKLPEDEDEDEDEESDDDDSYETLGKSKLVMVTIPKSSLFAFEDDPPMGPLGHEDVDTAAQGVHGKLLIIIRALDFLGKQNNGDSYNKVTARGFAIPFQKDGVFVVLVDNVLGDLVALGFQKITCPADCWHAVIDSDELRFCGAAPVEFLLGRGDDGESSSHR
jgi:hypothetical protein